MAIWLLLLPAAASLWLVHYTVRQGFRRRAGFGTALRALSRLSSGRRDALVLAAALIAPAALILSMMRPQLLLDRREPVYQPQDLVLILDRSASMRSRDIPPSRLDRAITEIKTFLRSKPDAIDRIGLVGFAGTSVTLSYMTRDVNTLFYFLDWMRNDPGIYYGTDIAAALGTARALARRDSSKSRKRFLLISDGDNQGPDLPAVLEELRRDGIEVDTIGIGSEDEVPIPVSGRNGRVAYLTDKQGRPLTTHFNAATLRRVAALTGGQFFRSTSGHELADTMQRVAQARRRPIGWRHSTAYRDVHAPLLMVAGAATLFLLMKA